MVKIALTQDTYQASKDDRFVIRLRITDNRNVKYIVLDERLTESEFAKIQAGKPTKDIKDQAIRLEFHLTRAKSIAQKIEPFDIKEFKNKFSGTENAVMKCAKIEPLFTSIITGKRTLKAFSTADSYESTLHKLIAYKGNVAITDITKEFLLGFENFIDPTAKGTATVGIYMRNIRASLNIAIDKGILAQSAYPFGKKQYVIKGSRNNKRALAKEQLSLIFNYQDSNPLSIKQRSIDFFVMSYLLNGINFKDLLLITKAQFQETHFNFVRSKTKGSNTINIYVPVIQEALNRINKWRCKDSKNAYLFPFLNIITDSKKTLKSIEERQYNTKKQFIKTTNKHLAIVAQELGLPLFGTYFARHSFATASIQAGVNSHVLKEQMGHTSILTTDKYISTLPVQNILEKQSAVLLPF
jgi:integrase/recombinase XerD